MVNNLNFRQSSIIYQFFSVSVLHVSLLEVLRFYFLLNPDLESPKGLKSDSVSKPGIITPLVFICLGKRAIKSILQETAYSGGGRKKDNCCITKHRRSGHEKCIVPFGPRVDNLCRKKG